MWFTPSCPHSYSGWPKDPMVMDKLCAIIHQHLVNCRSAQYLYSEIDSGLVATSVKASECVKFSHRPSGKSSWEASRFSSAFANIQNFWAKDFSFSVSPILFKTWERKILLGVARLSIILLIGRGLILTESKKVVESASQLDNHWFCWSAPEPEEMSKPYCSEYIYWVMSLFKSVPHILSITGFLDLHLRCANHKAEGTTGHISKIKYLKKPLHHIRGC